MCCVLLETTMLCMSRTICLKPIDGCVELIICATSCICDLANYLWYLMDEFFCLVTILVVVMSNICPANK
jgi:hypothetical protein